jgi:hypothetical protein
LTKLRAAGANVPAKGGNLETDPSAAGRLFPRDERDAGCDAARMTGFTRVSVILRAVSPRRLHFRLR